jgi:hypothetical protein
MKDEIAAALGFESKARARSTPGNDPPATGPDLKREGLDLALEWPDGVRFALAAIRDGREGVRGELTVTVDGRRLAWGAWSLSSTQARETICKKLAHLAPKTHWGPYLEDGAYRLTCAAREGEPFVTLTGVPRSSTRELVPRFLYEGEPTLLYADGDTGKSRFALTLAAAVQSGTSLPNGLTPARAVSVAYLDWETSRDTFETRLSEVAAGLGIAPPPILYKRMHRPLVDAASALASDLARRRIGVVIVDSQMLAVAGGEGAPFHEGAIGLYNGLRLFAPAACLVLNHVTGADARSGTPARPFGGAFAFNVPRLIWEARRDNDDDAHAIVFTCRKANNLPRRPDPFGLRFDATTISALDLRDAGSVTLAGASLVYRLRLALARGAQTVEALAADLEVTENTIRRALNRWRRKDRKGLFVAIEGSKPQLWALAAGIEP